MKYGSSAEEIAERIYQRMEELDLSYQDLADRTGLSKSTLQRYVTGYIKNIPLSKVDILAKGLEVTPEHLLGWDIVDTETPAEEINDERLLSIIKGSPLLKNFVKYFVSLDNDKQEMIVKMLRPIVEAEAAKEDSE